MKIVTHMMTRWLGALALSAMLPAAALAQSCGTIDLIDTLTSEERAELDTYVAPHVYPEGNLWRAEKDGSTVIVVGTLHIPDPRLDPIAERVAPYVRDADLLVLEATSEDQAGLAAMAAAKPEFFFLTEGPSLIDLLGEADWALASARAQELGIPGFLAAKFQPWYMNLTLATPPCAMAAIQSGEVGLDRRLEEIAAEESVPVAALDDTEALLRLFAEDPIEEQLESLRLTLTTQADTEANASTLIEAYFDGRVREGWEFARILIERAEIEDGDAMFDEMNATLLVGRNRDWEPQIAEMVAAKDVVIAVGAAHLSGESGVLRALERAGYAVERL